MPTEALALALPDAVTAWVGTYLVHSTLLLGTAWIAVRLFQRMPVRVQESLWRTALLGGVLTASAQMAIGWEPWSGRLDVPAREVATQQTPAVPLAGETPLQPLPAVAPEPLAAAGDEGLTLYPVGSVDARSPAPGVDPFTLLVGLWFAGVALLLLRARGARRGLRRRIAARRPLKAGNLVARLDALRAATGVRCRVRLTESDGVGSPVALGILRPEIVVPARAAAELSDAEQEVMLAHELAHHVRRDPLWRAVTRLVAGGLFFQPLNLLASKRLRETSELLCDAWAAERTGRGRELAECLAKVAAWMLRDRRALAVPAMAAEGSMLERRVACLLQESECTHAGPRGGRLLALLPLVLVAVFAPVVASGATPAATPARMEAPAPTLRSEPAPARDVAHALARLDEEITGLETELDVLLGLLRQVTAAPESLRRGAARLAARLTACKERRVALTAGDAKESTR